MGHLFSENNFRIGNKTRKANFDINEDNVITATTIRNSPSTYMGTVRHYDDFILEYEIFATPGLNSGVQFESCFEKPSIRISMWT